MSPPVPLMIPTHVHVLLHVHYAKNIAMMMTVAVYHREIYSPILVQQISRGKVRNRSGTREGVLTIVASAMIVAMTGTFTPPILSSLMTPSCPPIPRSIVPT